MNSESKNIDMCSGSLFDKILFFSVPLMLSGILQLLYNAADVIVVGRFAGQDSLAAVGTTGAVINLTLNLFLGLAGGVSVAMARCVGARNDKETHKVVHTAITVSVIGGALLTIIGTMFSKNLLKLISVPDDVLPQATAYMQIIFYGMIPSMIYNFGSAVLRSKGDTKRPLLVIFISGIINVVLNLYFVIEFKMGAEGVGLATIISQFISAALILFILSKQNDSSKLYFKKLGIDKKQLMFIIKIGIPAGMQGVVFSLSNVIIQSGINSFGSATIAGCAAAGNIEGFMFTSLNTFNQSAMTFISQNIGAKRYERIGRVIKDCTLYVTILGIIIAFIAYFCGEFLMKIYCPNDPDAISIGYLRLQIVGISYILCGLQDVMCGSLRGMGASLSGMVTAIAGVCGIRIVWIFTVFKSIGTFQSLLISFPVSWLGTFVLYLGLYMIVKRKFVIHTNLLKQHN